MKLSSEEIERYSRQIVLRGVGGPGQNKLKAARALVIGAGGLGSPVLLYLAGAGLVVYEHEPQVAPELLAMPNVVLTPHLGSAVSSLRESMAHVVVDNTIALIAGKPPVSCLNPQVLKNRY